MNRKDLNECVALIGDILGYLMANVPAGATVGAAGAQIKADVGDLIADAGTLIFDNEVAQPFATCFDDAFNCGIDLLHMMRVRSLIAALSPVSKSAIYLVEAAQFLALVEESKILAAMSFTSSNQVESLITQMREEFADSIEAAADRDDATVYQSIVALAGSVTSMLTSTAWTLPNIVNYTVGKPMPSLALAQLLYADPTRADQLAAENSVIHPAFMPASGTALSA